MGVASMETRTHSTAVHRQFPIPVRLDVFALAGQKAIKIPTELRFAIRISSETTYIREYPGFQFQQRRSPPTVICRELAATSNTRPAFSTNDLGNRCEFAGKHPGPDRTDGGVGGAAHRRGFIFVGSLPTTDGTLTLSPRDVSLVLVRWQSGGAFSGGVVNGRGI